MLWKMLQQKKRWTKHEEFKISKKDNTMWEKMMDLDTRAKKSNKGIKVGFRIIK